VRCRCAMSEEGWCERGSRGRLTAVGFAAPDSGRGGKGKGRGEIVPLGFSGGLVRL
jgi:hypothetical protein